MVKNWKALIATLAGLFCLTGVVIVAMNNHIDGALYFWVVAGIIWIVRGNLPDIFRRANGPR